MAGSPFVVNRKVCSEQEGLYSPAFDRLKAKAKLKGGLSSVALNEIISIYYKYEQEVLLRVLRDLSQKQFPSDPARALRWQEAQAAHDRALPADSSADGGGNQSEEQQHHGLIVLASIFFSPQIDNYI